jgi:hypothetical protein
MNRPLAVALYIIVMAAIIVGVDVKYFRNRVGARLIANIGIVLLFAVVYLSFFRRP